LRISAQIYLPIAELPINIFVLLGIGIAVGFISGLFGVGGGFHMTPLLISIGIPPAVAVAVATVSSHMAAASTSSVLSYWRRNAVDVHLALVLLTGGVVGMLTGVRLFTLLRSVDLLDLLLAVSYVILLGSVGGLMLIESVRFIVRQSRGDPVMVRKAGSHNWQTFTQSAWWIPVHELAANKALIRFDHCARLRPGLRRAIDCDIERASGSRLVQRRFSRSMRPPRSEQRSQPSGIGSRRVFGASDTPSRSTVPAPPGIRETPTRAFPVGTAET